jgi:hypothetical protein
MIYAGMYGLRPLQVAPLLLMPSIRNTAPHQDQGKPITPGCCFLNAVALVKVLLTNTILSEYNTRVECRIEKT